MCIEITAVNIMDEAHPEHFSQCLERGVTSITTPHHRVRSIPASDSVITSLLLKFIQAKPEKGARGVFSPIGLSIAEKCAKAYR